MTAHRNRSRTALAVAALAALSLSLTACNGSGSGTKDEGAASSGRTATDSAAKNTGGSSDAGSSKTSGGTDASAAGAKDATTGKSSTGGSGSGAKGGTASKAAPECKVGYLDYSLKRENPEQQGDHLLITAENRSATACTVQKFPVVTPGDANGDVPLAKDDQQPAQPILVQPGGRVYSAIAVIQDVKAEDDYFKSIRLSLQMNNSDDSLENVKLVTPGEVEYAGKMADGIEVLSWNTRRPYAN